MDTQILPIIKKKIIKPTISSEYILDQDESRINGQDKKFRRQNSIMSFISDLKFNITNSPPANLRTNLY